MDEGILEVSELAGDRVVELRVIDELRVVGLITCERETSSGDEGPVSGVAQVVCHGVKVVGVHGEEGREEDGKVRGRGKRRSRATQRETLIMDGMWMKVKDSRDLSQCGCDTCVTKKTRHLTACRRAQTSRMLCLCLLVYVMYVVSQLSTLVLKVYLSLYTFA